MMTVLISIYFYKLKTQRNKKKLHHYASFSINENSIFSTEQKRLLVPQTTI